MWRTRSANVTPSPHEGAMPLDVLHLGDGGHLAPSTAVNPFEGRATWTRAYLILGLASCVQLWCKAPRLACCRHKSAVGASVACNGDKRKRPPRQGVSCRPPFACASFDSSAAICLSRPWAAC